MIDTLKKKMDENYDFKVDINKSFEEQNLLDETKAILANIFRDYWATPYQKERIEAKEKYDRQKDEAIAMIALLHLNYWCCDNNEKERLNTIFDDNENKYQKELSEKYNPDNLFKNKQPKIKTVENSVATIEYKESIFTKIKNGLSGLFNK